MIVADKKVLDKIFISHRGAAPAYTTPSLSAVLRGVGPLDQSLMRNGNHHLIIFDQVLDENIPATRIVYLRSAFRTVFLAHLQQFGPDDGHSHSMIVQNFLQACDLPQDFRILIFNFLPLKARQTVQAEFENRLGLNLGE